MSSAESTHEHRLVAALTIAVLGFYLPAAEYLQLTYVSDMASAPNGAVRQIIQLQKYSANGIAFLEKAVSYRTQAGLMIYEGSPWGFSGFGGFRFGVVGDRVPPCSFKLW